MPWVLEPRLGRRGSRNQTDYIRRYVTVVKPGQKVVKEDPPAQSQGVASVL